MLRLSLGKPKAELSILLSTVFYEHVRPAHGLGSRLRGRRRC